jgi:hypothetical protein
MKYFKQLCKTAREQGVLLDTSAPHFGASQAFWVSANQAEVFVFSGSGFANPYDLPEQDDETPIDAPFMAFSIEQASGPLVKAREDFYSDYLGTLEVYCILAAVTNVRRKSMAAGFEQWAYYILVRDRADKFVVMMIVDDEIADPNNTHLTFSSIVRAYLDRISTEKEGLEETSERIRLPNHPSNPKKKAHREIRRVFHITPRTSVRKYSEALGPSRLIDWTHRWLVRGHWMYYDDKTKVGKNRNGEYVERGRTWRNQHERGPEDKPLVKKIRVVDEPRT